MDVEQVNNGNTGWTRAHVMTALEKVFYELGWNSGTQKSGVPCLCLGPGDTLTETPPMSSYAEHGLPTSDQATLWRKCGGVHSTLTSRLYRFYWVGSTNTDSYDIGEQLVIQDGYVGSGDDTIPVHNHAAADWPTGTPVVYGLTGDGGNDEVDELTLNTTYYVIRVPDNTTSIKLADSQPNANAGTAIDLTTSSGYMSNCVKLTKPLTANPDITVNWGDELNFEWHQTDGSTFTICDFAENGYHVDRVLNDTNTYNRGGYLPIGDGTDSSPFAWDTRYWNITETEKYDPLKVDGIGYQGLHSYGYASDTNPNMKGNIIILPFMPSNGAGYDYETYWKYTVSGATADANNPGTGRTDLNLRIYRHVDGSHRGDIKAIMITNVAENWQENDTFTIPGDQIGEGMVSPTNDIVFGVNAPEQVSNTNDGTPSLVVTNIGAGSNMYQKHPDGDYGILRLENDTAVARKKFGTTFWGFSIDKDQPYKLMIDSGVSWMVLNRAGINVPPNNDYGYLWGVYQGDYGLDIMSTNNYLHSNQGSGSNWHQIAASSSTTNYPLEIRYYKAQQPHDTNFAIIQFTQLIDTKVVTYFTFALHKGEFYGSSIWDLDDVWLGTYSTFFTQHTEGGSTSSTSRDRWIGTRYTLPGYDYSSVHAEREVVNTNSKARESSYGFMRNSTGGGFDPVTYYYCNIDTSVNNTVATVETYFRDSTYDKVDYSGQNNGVDPLRVNNTVSVGAGADYYKPIKGLPVINRFAPCPYYLPDDFVMIQAAVTPGQTTFRSGDTVEITTDEKYTIIIGDQQYDQNALDNVNGNTSIGMLFCARQP